MINTRMENYRLTPFVNIVEKKNISKTIPTVYKKGNTITNKFILVHKFNNSLILEIVINVTNNTTKL